MKKLLTLLLLCTCLNAFSYPSKRDFAFTIIFAGNFHNDLVSLSLNKKKILHQYKVDNSDVAMKGHLSLTQYSKEIKVSYNGNEIMKPGVATEHFLTMQVVING